MTQPNNTTTLTEPVTRLIKAVAAYRRAKESASKANAPTYPKRWDEVCEALDDLTLKGALDA